MAKDAIEHSLRKHSLRKQRPVKPFLVSRYTRSMQNGAWRVTHEALAFTSAGWILDGQHRLLAIIQANIPVKMMVFFNQPDENFTCINTPGPRTNQDAIHCAGLELFKTQASVVRMMFLTSRCRNRIENDDVIKLTKRLWDGLEYVAKHLFHQNTQRICTAQMGACILRAYYKYPQKRNLLDRFCDLVHNPAGSTTKVEMGVFKLRDWLMTGSKRMQGAVIDEYRRINTSLHLFLNGIVQEKLYADKEEHFFHPDEHNLLRIADNTPADEATGYFIVPLCKKSDGGVERTPMQRFSAVLGDKECRMPNTNPPPKEGDKVVFVAKLEGSVNGKVVGMAFVKNTSFESRTNFPTLSTVTRTKCGDPQPIKASLCQVKGFTGPFLKEVEGRLNVKVDHSLITVGVRINGTSFNVLTGK